MSVDHGVFLGVHSSNAGSLNTRVIRVAPVFLRHTLGMVLK